ncbi:MAG: bifunctional folylpolyglutamate synthase/dihydrofolate synthase [Anaerolineaceae bacterium]|nr:bifunctional folylpolyglutamate synthase/dihydrofolate synthase [Anaerolineaceae bacterium]
MIDAETAYQQALDYLYSFVDYSLTRSFRFTPEKFDLGRMVELMARLGNPQDRYPILHVAGTKGKGSVAALCASVLRTAGYQVGLYTSPHLQDYTERIQLNGQPIPHADLVRLVDELRPHVDVIEKLTTFELTTALAFLYFSRKGVTAAVVEVGLGGRLDATNIITPCVSVITTLSYDHMNVLGDTLTKIATEKTGIIKPNRPVVSAPQQGEALRIINQAADDQKSQLILVGRDWLFSPVRHTLDGQTLLVWPASEQEEMNAYIEFEKRTDYQPKRLNIPLLGYHQVENAATAYAALQAARSEGFVISENQIIDGFNQVKWPARFEVLRRDPPVVVDSAHNPDSALKLRLALEDYFHGLPVILVFGASEDKDVRGMFQNLLPRIRQVIATQSIHPRALEAEKIVELAHQFGVPAQAVLPLELALQNALALAGKDAAVVATGSLFVAAGTRHAWFDLNPTERYPVKASQTES